MTPGGLFERLDGTVHEDTRVGERGSTSGLHRVPFSVGGAGLRIKEKARVSTVSPVE